MDPVLGIAMVGIDDSSSDSGEFFTGCTQEEIRTIQPKGSYFLGGYSFGGTVAFEIAQQLKTQGEEVGVLWLLDFHFSGRKGSRFRRYKKNHSFA